ncbi:TetR/AcrR family transcriptional regulator [Actinoplanes couchii]|uniref:TetR family transcriptional regulator n=2 Tax=Actinoplanes couchii TaxID=403638 RepID=A0ABQ3XEE1_9ACTN|nr:TetR family transcriptional regulator [Actinoplanes couchii]
MRERIADVAAGLFAERGYDGVSMIEVARAATVSEQTVYNYFPAKQDLVLDRADEIREQYHRAVATRPPGTSPASALHLLVIGLITHFRSEELSLARGEFPAQCLISPVLRRFALEVREQQAQTIGDAIRTTDPAVPAIVARAHAAAIVAVVQSITDDIGTHVRSGDVSDEAADRMRRTAALAFDHLDQAFRSITTTYRGDPR